MRSSMLAVAALVAGASANQECKPFSEIYANGQELCENMWGGAFRYETDLDNAYSMWFFGDNPNPAVSQRLNVTGYPVNDCHLGEDNSTYHKVTPGPEPDSLMECHPWKENACCKDSTVTSPEDINAIYGPEWSWNRCGQLSQACERWFVQEACFYECEPQAGLWRKWALDVFDPGNEDHNTWQLENMPIRADHCDAWHRACYNDLFCGRSTANETGNFFECARIAAATTLDDDEKLSSEAKAIIAVVGSIAGIALIGLVVMCVLRKKDFQRLKEEEGGDAGTELTIHA